MLKSSDYPALEALTAIAETGSFERAAARIGVTTGAVSQRLRGLEDRVGAVLIRRVTPAEATGAGARLIRHYSEVRALEAGLADMLGGEADLPVLRIAVNADSMAAWALDGFAQVPGVLFDFEIDDQDHSDDWLRSGAVSAAITARESPIRGCDVVPLGRLPYRAVAAPAFYARHFADGVDRHSLSRAPALTFNRKDKLQRNWVRAITGEDPDLPTHYLPSTQDITTAACLGMGWGMNPASHLDPLIAAGRLVSLSDTPFHIPLYWQVARLSAPALAPVTQALVAQARATLDPFD